MWSHWRAVQARCFSSARMGGKGKRKAGRSGGAAAAGAGDRVVLDRGVHKLVKDCLHCKRPMTWRKKWERNWDTVVYCSDKCKKEAARQRRRSSQEAKAEQSPAPAPQPQPQDAK
jgi:hypothetical protein